MLKYRSRFLWINLDVRSSDPCRSNTNLIYLALLERAAFRSELDRDGRPFPKLEKGLKVVVADISQSGAGAGSSFGRVNSN
jgi:hypothetical protein